jgi:hypothetical protein
MTETKTRTPLGDKSSLYLTKSKARGAIWDHPDQSYLEFYPSGYSHSSRKDHQSRQIVHQALFEAAVQRGKEEEEYPFEGIEHTLELVPDVQNPVDDNALWVILHSTHPALKHCNGKDIGFVPKEIAPVMKRNLDLIKEGKIYKLRPNWNKKFYTCKIVLNYGELIVVDDPMLNRFADIIMEA